MLQYEKPCSGASHAVFAIRLSQAPKHVHEQSNACRAMVESLTHSFVLKDKRDARSEGTWESHGWRVIFFHCLSRRND